MEVLHMFSLWKCVKSDWFYTRTATFTFGASAILVCLFIGSAEFFPRLLSFDGHTTVQQVGYALLGGCLGFSNALIVVGMFRFWVVCDESSRVARRVWFVVMVVGLLRLGLGAAIYCFAVYLPQVAKVLRQRPRAVV
jgi:hypothetical protein